MRKFLTGGLVAITMLAAVPVAAHAEGPTRIAPAPRPSTLPDVDGYIGCMWGELERLAGIALENGSLAEGAWDNASKDCAKKNGF